MDLKAQKEGADGMSDGGLPHLQPPKDNELPLARIPVSNINSEACFPKTIAVVSDNLNHMPQLVINPTEFTR